MGSFDFSRSIVVMVINVLEIKLKEKLIIFYIYFFFRKKSTIEFLRRKRNGRSGKI